MAGRGPTAQPDSKGNRATQRPKAPPPVALVPHPNVPECPEGVLPAIRAWWVDYWGSELARAVQADTDLPGIRRLAKLYDRSARADLEMDESDLGPMTAGSQGQLVPHPLAKLQLAWMNEIRQLEDRFGCNPRAKLSIGLQLTQARQSLESLNATQSKAKPLKAVDQAGDDHPTGSR